MRYNIFYYLGYVICIESITSNSEREEHQMRLDVDP